MNRGMVTMEIHSISFCSSIQLCSISSSSFSSHSFFEAHKSWRKSFPWRVCRSKESQWVKNCSNGFKHFSFRGTFCWLIWTFGYQVILNSVPEYSKYFRYGILYSIPLWNWLQKLFQVRPPFSQIHGWFLKYFFWFWTKLSCFFTWIDSSQKIVHIHVFHNLLCSRRSNLF